jgi:hypothetical protein
MDGFGAVNPDDLYWPRCGMPASLLIESSAEGISAVTIGKSHHLWVARSGTASGKSAVSFPIYATLKTRWKPDTHWRPAARIRDWIFGLMVAEGRA